MFFITALFVCLAVAVDAQAPPFIEHNTLAFQRQHGAYAGYFPGKGVIGALHILDNHTANFMSMQTFEEQSDITFIGTTNEGELKNITTIQLDRTPRDFQVSFLFNIHDVSRITAVDSDGLMDNMVWLQGVKVPEPFVVGPLSSLSHGVSSGPITLLDSRTFLILGLYYDNTAPDVYFYAGRGAKPDSSGFIVPDQHGSMFRLTQEYRNATVIIKLPAKTTMYDIDYLSLYCIKFADNLGQVVIPINYQPLLLPPDYGQHQIGMKQENFESSASSVAVPQLLLLLALLLTSWN